MGDFAELNTRFKLKVDTPNEVIEIIKYMTGKGEEPATLPNYQIFSTENWDTMLRSFSDDTNIRGEFSFFEKHPRFDCWELCVRSVFRDRNEIKSFYNWVHPYIDNIWLGFLGYVVLDEVGEHPYLIYFKDEGIRFMKVSCDEKEDLARDEVLFNWNIFDATGN
ncbi:hypothetical protein ACDZ28_00660 (plasmid) [Paenibacillus sp. RS8]|uniref:hypothetical protein n=1 Tax=Paenibacillus sp. RS8 TaxID=3242681 RepID=UPI0035BFFC58